jgi:hypothetical protein
MDNKAVVRFLDADHKRVEIDGVEYIRSWKKPKKQVSRNGYMRIYRSQRRDELQVYRELLRRLNEIPTVGKVN